MSKKYKNTVKELCSKYGLTAFLVDGEFRVYRDVEEVIIGDYPITVFYYRDPDTWTRDSIENQIVEGLLTRGF